MKQVIGQVRRVLVDLFWNLVIVGLTVTGCYLAYTRGNLDRFLKSPVANPAPQVAAAAVAKPSDQPGGQAPAQVAPEQPAPTATPEPTPAPAVSNAAPTPEPPLDLGTVDKRSLPMLVKLRQPVDFPIVSNGQQVGLTASPAGMMVRLVGVQGDQLEVECAGVRRLIPAGSTDVASRVRVLQQFTAAAASAAAPASTPAATPWVPMLKGTH